jgi:Mrp family chromosome partitioning ATPase
VLASHADGVLLAFTHDKLRRDPARNTIGALRQVKARILGVVLNRVEGSQHGYYYSYHKSYGNQYYTTHYSSQKANKARRVSTRTAVAATTPPVQSHANGNGAAIAHSVERTQQPGS